MFDFEIYNAFISEEMVEECVRERERGIIDRDDDGECNWSAQNLLSFNDHDLSRRDLNVMGVEEEFECALRGPMKHRLHDEGLPPLFRLRRTQ